MNVEVEKKFYIDDYKKIRLEILGLGSKLISTTNDIDLYFIVPQKIPNTIYLRVRTRAGKSTLAYHEVLNDVETKEWESNVDNGKTVIEIIKKLGFREDVMVNKTRERYKLDKSEILIDHVVGLGYFVEIEAINEKELDDIVGKLSVGKQISGVGYPDLIKGNC